MQLKDDSKQVLIGSILGDGYVCYNGPNCYFEEIHSAKQTEYLEWKRGYLPNSKLTPRIFNNRKLGKKYKLARLKMPTDPYFTTIREVFYPNGKKILPKRFLNQLDELGLTVWYLDDGHVNILSNLVNISTDSFSLDENYAIKKFLRKKWKIDPKVSKRKNKYYLTFDRANSDKMLNLLADSFEKYNIPESLKYKLGRLWEGNNEKLKKDRAKRNRYKKEWRAKRTKIRLKEKEKKEEERVDKIKDLYYKKQKSLAEIAKELGYNTHVTILKVMKKHKLKRRTLSEACAGEKNGFFGREHSKRTKEKISKAKKKGD